MTTLGVAGGSEGSMAVGGRGEIGLGTLLECAGGRTGAENRAKPLVKRGRLEASTKEQSAGEGASVA